MLVAKLSSELEFVIPVSPINTEKRVADCFHVVILHYQLAGEDVSLRVHFTKEMDAPKNPSSDVVGEGEMKKIYEEQKVFVINLTSEELKNWGSDDKSLLDIVANKYNLTIVDYITIDSTN